LIDVLHHKGRLKDIDSFKALFLIPDNNRHLPVGSSLDLADTIILLILGSNDDINPEVQTMVDPDGIAGQSIIDMTTPLWKGWF
jgi:hypothetical protein